MSMKRKLLKYIFVNVFAMIGMSCYIMADTFFISVSEGSLGIAALNLVLPIYSLIYAIGSMIGTGSATKFAICRAEKKKDEEPLYFFNAVFFCIVIGGLFAVTGCLFPEQVLAFLGGDDDIIREGTGYTRIFMAFAPAFMLNYVFTGFVRNDQRPGLAMAATLISSFANIVMDYILIFMFDLGMTGAAAATATSPFISMAICSVHIFRLDKRVSQNSGFFVLCKPSLKRLYQSCLLGISAFIGEISSGITITVFNFILLDLAGNDAVAAYGIIANIGLAGTAIFNGISLGTQPLVSDAHGRGDREEKEYLLRQILKVAAVFAVLLVLALELTARQCVDIFNSGHSEALERYALYGLRIYLTGFLFAGINIAGSGYFSASEKVGEAFAISLLRGLVGIVFAGIVLAYFFGLTGVWMAYPVTEGVTMVVTGYFIYKIK